MTYPVYCEYCWGQSPVKVRQKKTLPAGPTSKTVYPCTDRIDDGVTGRNITVLRCVLCGNDA